MIERLSNICGEWRALLLEESGKNISAPRELIMRTLQETEDLIEVLDEMDLKEAPAGG